MANAAFDTLSMAQRLERDFDFPPKQAEGTAMLLHEHVVGNTVSKEDFDAFVKSNEARFDAFEKTVEARFEGIDARFKEAEAKDDARIAEVKNDLKWIKIIGAVIVAATVTPWLTELLSPLFK